MAESAEEHVMEKLIMLCAAALIGTGCVGVAYESRDGRMKAEGTMLSAPGAVQVMNAGVFADVAGEVGGKKPIFAMNCADGDGYGRGGCTVVTNMRGANLYGQQFGNGVVDPYYAGQIAQARTLGASPSRRDPVTAGKSDVGGKAGTVVERLDGLEKTVGEHEAELGAHAKAARKRAGKK